jgi:hypothetical protein
MGSHTEGRKLVKVMNERTSKVRELFLCEGHPRNNDHTLGIKKGVIGGSRRIIELLREAVHPVKPVSLYATREIRTTYV